ncbi:MAG: SurA N-terminal domain-containing protein [Alphaproteobacteria bacterium]|nr:SurA N-terminal domain-containing protein [Alphaproteobacteria bacterium]MDP6815382.1 SurA N-terminal domain-containing protein [Alphaproteobacteria bacterium]
MLNALRQSAGSWVVKIFLGLLVLSFAAWGIGDIFRVRPDAAVATIGDVDITGYEFLNDFNREMRRMQASLGPRFDTEQARRLGLVNRVLQQSITRALYDQEVEDLELTMSDEDIAAWIRNAPAFKNSFGRFDQLRFEQVLRQNGFTEQSYVAVSRRDLSREQLINSVVGGARAPKAMVRALFDYQQERRRFEVLNLSHAAIGGVAEPNDGDLAQYYEANKDSFYAPEYRGLTFITMRPDDLAGEILVDEAELRELYEARLNEFTTRASREVEQIVVQEEAIAQQVVGRLREGGDFLAVARKLADMDADAVKLGEVVEADLPEEAAKVVFALAEGEISGAVETALGWHVFRVVKAQQGGSKTFEEVRETLVKDLKLEKALDAMFELANKVEDEFAGGSSATEVAEALRLTHGRIAAVDRTGRNRDGEPVDSLPKAPEFLETAFSAEPGDDPELKESDDGSYYLVQVDKVFESAVRPLAEVRDDVRQAVASQRRAEAAAKRAAELAERARGGAALAELATAAGAAYSKTEAINRNQAASDNQLGAELVEQAFRLTANGVAEGPAQSGDSHSVVRLLAVERTDPAEQPELLGRLDEFLRGGIADDVLSQYRDALQGKYDVEINDGIIDSLFDQTNVRG